MLHGHGDDLHDCGHAIRANFSSNIFAATDLTALQRHLAAHLDVIGRYPEPEPRTLEARWAASLGIRPEEMCVTNGATEAIYLIAQTFRGATSYVRQPTFSEYADACRMHGHRVRSVFTDGAIDDAPDLVWLCNPNNPTGEVRDRDTLLRLIDAHPTVCFVVDESYGAFTRQPLPTAAEITERPNAIVIRSATKRHTVPGLRLGCLTASEALVERIRVQRMPWSVNALAVEAGMYFLSEQTPMRPSIDELLTERDRLMDGLAALKIAELWPTDTHFFLARLRMGTAAALKYYLIQEHGLLIRDASNFEGLDASFVRIATQGRADNDLLIQSLSEWKHTYFS